MYVEHKDSLYFYFSIGQFIAESTAVLWLLTTQL